MPARTTLFERLWESHVVRSLGADTYLLHVDRHLLHDLSGTRGLRMIREHGYSVRNPELCVATADHSISTAPGRSLDSAPRSAALAGGLAKHSQRWGIRHFGIDDAEQGIVHVIGPELGITQPGMLLVCGDSHTCTHGALGSLAWGIGSSEVEHVLATQTIIQQKPKRMRVHIQGTLGRWVTAKDLILYIIGKLGADAGVGYAVEFAGSTLEGMSIEERMTVCNLAIELGARMGIVGPDATTFEYLAGKRFAPKGKGWDKALAYWKSLPTDDGATFDREESIDAGTIEPQITWGTSPEHVIGVRDSIPDPERATVNRREGMRGALEYIGLHAGDPIANTPVDRVFIGSCTNSRIEDLRAAAQVVEGRRVAPTVSAWIVPGSQAVKRQAEAEGLDRRFKEAGFEWREPGCSMCLAANGETVAPEDRCVSTSNRNFVGRQGKGSRTHLASPAMAAAAAVTGKITDVRELMR